MNASTSAPIPTAFFRQLVSGEYFAAGDEIKSPKETEWKPIPVGYYGLRYVAQLPEGLNFRRPSGAAAALDLFAASTDALATMRAVIEGIRHHPDLCEQFGLLLHSSCNLQRAAIARAVGDPFVVWAKKHGDDPWCIVVDGLNGSAAAQAARVAFQSTNGGRAKALPAGFEP